MKNGLKQYRYIVFLLTLISCEQYRDTDLEFEFNGSKIFAFTLLGDTSLNAVYVAKTIPVFSEESDRIADAKVYLIENDNTSFELSELKEKLYSNSNSFHPLLDGKYRIKVESAQLGNVISDEVFFPAGISIDSLTVSRIQINKTIVCIHFQDPCTENYYAFRVERFFFDSVLNESHIKIFERGSIFTDAGFNGKNFIKQVKMDGWGYTSEGKSRECNRVKVTLYSLTKSTYNFFKSLNESSTATNNFYAVPAPVESNIKGGYGHFGAYLSSTKEKEFK